MEIIFKKFTSCLDFKTARNENPKYFPKTKKGIAKSKIRKTSNNSSLISKSSLKK